MAIRNNWSNGQSVASADLNDITNAINATYTKPGTGIPMSDLATAVQNLVGVKTSVPSTPTSTGVAGQVAANSTHLYVCTATNTWRRVAITTW